MTQGKSRQQIPLWGYEIDIGYDRLEGSVEAENLPHAFSQVDEIIQDYPSRSRTFANIQVWKRRAMNRVGS